MKSLAERLHEDQRLVILRVLADLPGYTSNSSVLFAELRHMGHVVSRDVVKTHLHWLAEQSLVRLDDAVEDVLVVTLTERGGDVAAGFTYVPGIKRPGAH